MNRISKKIFAVLLFAILTGCSIDTWEVTKSGYTWTYQGMINDTTAVAKVEHWESGTIHCDHFMSMDDGETFTNTLSTSFYSISLNENKLIEKKSSLNAFIQNIVEVFEELPTWTDSCLAIDSIDGKFYCVNSSNIDEFSDACALIIVDGNKKDLDSLEFEHCDFNIQKDISFDGHYLKVSGDLFAIQNGKFKSQRPTYKIIDKGTPLIIVNTQGDSIFYEGRPR